MSTSESRFPIPKSDRESIWMVAAKAAYLRFLIQYFTYLGCGMGQRARAEAREVIGLL